MQKNLWKILSISVMTCFLIVAGCGDDSSSGENDGNGTNANAVSGCHAYPTCDDGDEEVETCPDDSTCYARSECATTITCEEAEVEGCDLPDSCSDDHDEVESCETDDCVEITTCAEETLYCEPTGEECEENPTCPAGFDPVDECAPESETGPDCIAVDSCDLEFFCQETCDAVPTCGEGEPQFDECPEGATCFEAEECGHTIHCMNEEPRVCEEYGCPQNYSAANPCEAEDECVWMFGCDDSVFCGGEPAPSPCDQDALCPDGWVEFDDCESAFDVCALSSVCGDTVKCAPEELVEEYQDPCDTTCPDGFSSVDDYMTCAEGTNGHDGSHCMYGDVCGTEIFCRADDPVDCQGSFDICTDSYDVVNGCETDDVCFFGMACDDFDWCGIAE